MDAGSIDRTPAVKIGDKIRLIRAADPYMGIKSREIGTIVDYSISKVIGRVKISYVDKMGKW